MLWALRDHRDIDVIDPVSYFNPDDLPPTPEMLVGTSHGDLHGRNVLVGIMNREGCYPVVFDYEDIRCCNPVGWGFVKLETELEKAAFSDPVFLEAGNDEELIQKLYAFELGLNERTAHCDNHNNWTEIEKGENEDDPLGRLARVILTIRRMA